MLTRALVILGLIALPSAGLLSGQGVPDSALGAALNGLDTILRHRADSGSFSGTVLVAALDGKGGRPLFTRAYGKADRTTGKPIEAGTAFITASTAKAFVAAGVMRLVDQGKLSLDAPVSRYLADSVFPHRRADSITIRQLLTHTAGLGNVVASPAFRSSPGALTRFDQIVALVRADSTRYAAGTFHYGDNDYILLGAVIAQVSRQSFADYMAKEIFGPAGMRSTSYAVIPRPDYLAHGYTVRNIGGSTYARTDSASGIPLRVNDPILPGVGVPGTVAYTTAPDLMHFADALWAHHLVSADAVQALWTGQVPTGQGDQNPMNREYGFGFFVGVNGPHRMVNHGGTGPGIDNGFDIYPDLGCVVVVLSNLDPPAGQTVRLTIREALAKVGRTGT